MAQMAQMVATALRAPLPGRQSGAFREWSCSGGVLAKRRSLGIFAGMSTLAEIENAVETLPRPEQETLWQHLSQRLFAPAGVAEPRQVAPNLWTGARERLRRIWGDQVLSEGEVAAMRDDEDGE